MLQGSVFLNNKTQSIRLPIEARFDKNVTHVTIRKSGKDRILSPVDNTWDSFFLANNLDQQVSDDFLTERAVQHESIREEF